MLQIFDGYLNLKDQLDGDIECKSTKDLVQHWMRVMNVNITKVN